MRVTLARTGFFFRLFLFELENPDKSFEMATPTGIEPVLSDVTDRCFSLLNYGAINIRFLLRFLFSILSSNR